MQNTSFEPSEVELPEDEYSLTRTRRRGSVYDAVAGMSLSLVSYKGSVPFLTIAGRINLRGNRETGLSASRYRDTISSTRRALRPEEALFRSNSDLAPDADNETYFANEHLPADRPLPSSDLLEAIHAYTADYYDYTTLDHGLDDHQSMDETALIAMGILIEELARESLGETGDLVLVEGQELLEEHSENDITSRAAGRILPRKRSNTRPSSSMVSSEDSLSGARRKFKRRKVAERASTTDPETENNKRT